MRSQCSSRIVLNYIKAVFSDGTYRVVVNVPRTEKKCQEIVTHFTGE